MDFFSGSASTAEAVMNISNENNISVSFVLVQLQENLDETL